MKRPPKFFSRLFQWFCNESLYEELQGDLEEAFYDNMQQKGLYRARWIYLIEVLKMIRPSVIRSVRVFPSQPMRLSHNYLKTSLRAIKLNPFYVFANIFGLALAISVCTIGYFNYRFNETFNSRFSEAENLYKIHGVRVGEPTIGTSSVALAPALDVTGIEAFRYLTKSPTLRDGNRLFTTQIAFCDDRFATYFPVHNLEGDPITAPEGSQMVISESLARRLFNDPYPIGQLVKIIFPNTIEQSFQVKDVFRDLPTNVSFRHSALLSMDSYISYYAVDEANWSNQVDGTFVHARHSELERIQTQVNDFLEVSNVNNPETELSEYRLDNVLEWPSDEYSLYGSHFRGHLHPSSVMGIAASAIAMLLLACFNFINTSIALSGKRLKEIAVRKVLGGNRVSTASQFLIENTFMISLAVVLSFGISYLLVPAFNALFEEAYIQLDRIPMRDILVFSLMLIGLVTVLSAAYPSLYVARFSALNIFRNKIIISGKNRLMTVLLTFQFALCFYNVFGLFLVVDNAQYQETLDRGYDVDQVVNMPLTSPDQYLVLAGYFAQSSEVVDVAGAQDLIGFSNETAFITHEGVEHMVSTVTVGAGYPEALGLRLRKGRFFHLKSWNHKEVIINKLLEDRLGQDLLHQHLLVGDNKYYVVGVVDDFNLRSIMMDHLITPTVIHLGAEGSFRYLSARVGGWPHEANRLLEEIWYQAFPDELYRGFPQQEVIKNSMHTNQVMLSINGFIAMMTILISILGLYTLIALKVQRRSKEFGVRKVLGASRQVIAHLLGKDLYWMVGIAALVGLSASAMVWRSVFDIIYAYHIAAGFSHFAYATMVVIAIMVITVAYKVYQTSKMNPVQQLRTE